MTSVNTSFVRTRTEIMHVRSTFCQQRLPASLTFPVSFASPIIESFVV